MGSSSVAPLRIVVNADDLGIRQDINDAIFDGMARGTITSATILANGPALREAVASLREFAGCSFGVHLNLTQFEPVNASNRGSLSPILDENHHFNGNAIREVKITPGLLRGIYQEWCAQIERLVSLGVRPSHFDAHHHVHTIPQMLPVLAALRLRYKVNKVRISRNMYTAAELPPRTLLLKKRFYNGVLRTVGYRTTRIFTDLVTFVSLCSGRAPEASSVELMAHPWSSPGSEEARLLGSDWTNGLSYPVELVNYSRI